MRIVWCFLWIVGLRSMAAIGLIAHKSILAMLLECVLCLFAAWFLNRHKGLKGLVVIYLIFKLIVNLNRVGIFCFGMSMWLLYITAKKEKD